MMLACSLFAIASFSQAKVDEVIKFDSNAHAFGKIKKGTPVTYEFVFTNPGKKPLIIEDATAECGCTKPEYPKEPVMKGKEAKIKVTYNAESMGSFSKKVTLKFANYAEPVIITIEGEVVAAK